MFKKWVENGGVEWADGRGDRMSPPTEVKYMGTGNL